MINRFFPVLLCLLGPTGAMGQTTGSATTDHGISGMIAACWNVGSLSRAAMDAKVIVAFELDGDRRPIGASLRLVDFSGSDEAAAQQAYEAARRAILRCGANGYTISQSFVGQTIQITFDPSGVSGR